MLGLLQSGIRRGFVGLFPACVCLPAAGPGAPTQGGMGVAEKGVGVEDGGVGVLAQPHDTMQKEFTSPHGMQEINQRHRSGEGGGV